MTTKSRTLSLSKRGLNFEMFMWLVTRLTALAMYALILFAIIGALVMGARTNMNMADVLRWGFMPNVTHVQSTNRIPRHGRHSSGNWLAVRFYS
jgi:succinate dehydrogenase hydrophobic anchor subunit